VSGGAAIIDRVTLAGTEAMPWLERMRAQYQPAAEARGMHLSGTWMRHADADAVEVCLVWELTDGAGFWAARAAARVDDTIDAWWAATDALVIDRQRHVYGAA
jgi:hypothetical protein